MKLTVSLLESDLKEKNNEILELKLHADSLRKSIDHFRSSASIDSAAIICFKNEITKLKDQIGIEKYSKELKVSEIQSLQAELSASRAAAESVQNELSAKAEFLEGKPADVQRQHDAELLLYKDKINKLE